MENMSCSKSVSTFKSKSAVEKGRGWKVQVQGNLALRKLVLGLAPCQDQKSWAGYLDEDSFSHTFNLSCVLY